MIRTPLRPLARILDARAKGENPDAIERENLRLRHEEMRDRARQRAEQRLLVLGAVFFCAFAVVGFRMGTLANSEPEEPRTSVAGAAVAAGRGDIVDRSGRLLATNLETHALYVHPHQLIDPDRAADKLVEIFPDLDGDYLKRTFHSDAKFRWLKRRISPEQQQAVMDIGEPGLLFGRREMRLYPNGPVASHILGGAAFDNEGVTSADIYGVAGVEARFNDYLSDPQNADHPLQLSIDLTIQAAVEQVLDSGIKLMSAKGGTAILMDVHTGEVIAEASLPDFDPNDRPPPPTEGHPEDSVLFNRGVQGRYELGSTFKIFAVAQALELGLVTPDTKIDVRAPIRWGRFTINDDHKYEPDMSVTRIIAKSSNIGTARIAQMIGPERQQAFLTSLGLTTPTSFELPDAKIAAPLLPQRWSELSMMTISFGHGLAASPLHLAAAYSTIANGGTQIRPTLLRKDGPQHGTRVISQRTADRALSMLRQVVTDGTASMAEVEGYRVAGKTGTADKAKPTGGYYDDRVIATFAGVFPSDAPKYVLITTLDEPSETSGPMPRRTAGWTAVPTAAEIIRRVAPLLGLRPKIEPVQLVDVSLSAN
ncbi:peptidoglycan D,D-transpeptidase FtsI family protein [Pseudooceanicola nanhaiensis]|uniref:peptidoglycan D,D-transpeptidase FtsI family protein n=1 Tax=Pseudooceanicola nanhaiensis TaxID=375761 RepID=UPI001CD2A419|nr:penicillin-binding protein 2 [Pseudooceanicola nanhaiensis]MCA0920095.1 penicillin-binding protein 2 [Pseudooceanicola nanhaiensis]